MQSRASFSPESGTSGPKIVCVRAVPTGLTSIFLAFPGLTPWARFVSPFGLAIRVPKRRLRYPTPDTGLGTQFVTADVKRLQLASDYEPLSTVSWLLRHCCRRAIHLFENPGCSATQQRIANLFAELNRIAAALLLAQNFRAIRTGNNRGELQSAILHLSEGANWDLASAAKFVQQRAFARRGTRGPRSRRETRDVRASQHHLRESRCQARPALRPDT